MRRVRLLMSAIVVIGACCLGAAAVASATDPYSPYIRVSRRRYLCRLRSLLLKGLPTVEQRHRSPR
jgi:hypothetical protein